MHCTGVALSHMCVMCLAYRLYCCLQTETDSESTQGMITGYIITGIIMEVLKTPMWCSVPRTHAATTGFAHDLQSLFLPF